MAKAQKRSNFIEPATEYKYKINGVKEVYYSVNSVELENNIGSANVKLKLGIQAIPDETNSCITIGLKLILYIDAPENKELLKYINETSFFIKNFLDVVSVKDHTFKLPPQAMTLFIGLSYSTLRGIVVEKTKYKVVLPALTPSQLYEEYLEQNLGGDETNMHTKK